MPPRRMPVRIVVMGPSGVGKSTVAQQLSSALGAAFIEADDLHTTANRAKISAGVPLTDHDRLPWLRAVGERIASVPASVAACSALKRSYRDTLRAAAPDVLFLELTAPPELTAERSRTREGHFASPDLVASQLAILEPLSVDEAGARIAAGADVATVLNAALDAVARLRSA
ncbi:gluconokinase [Gryllotalpicola reticulitermitis]|uniref:Gluconokinase n=1 Tax=Gryllotalpicola reticulitermitis TaxID=1184153 RepID=A0ABV8Q3N9_9MICO